MDTNLLTTDKMLFTQATALKIPDTTKPTPSVNTPKVSQAPDNTLPPTNTPETITTDNISSNPKNEPINKLRDDFNQTLQKEVKAESIPKNQKSIKPDKQNPTSELSSEVNLAKSTLAPEIPITLEELIKEKTSKMEPNTDRILAKLIANLKDGKSKPGTEQTAKSNETKLLENPEKNQLGIQSILPDKSKGQLIIKTVATDSVANLYKIQTLLSNISKGTSKTDTQSEKNKDNGEISVLDGNIIIKKTSTNIENNKELLSDALINSKDNESINNDSSKTIKPDNNLTDKSVIYTEEKTSILNATKKTSSQLTNISQNQNKINEADSQPIETVPVKSTAKADFSLLANKINGQDTQTIGIIEEKSKPQTNITTNNKITHTEIISESSNNKNEEIPNTLNKPPDNSTVKDLNTADVKISLNQSKKHNISPYDNNPHLDSEQTPPQNNPTTSVTVPSPKSTESTKTFELPSQNSPNNTLREIGKQILESIHNSYTQEGRNQYITVQLNPPELGKVLIKFQEQDSQIAGLLEVSKTQTKMEIEQVIPQVVRSLQESGIQIKRLDVTLSQGEQSEQGALREQTLQNGFTQQQGSADSYSGRNNPDADEINEWLINDRSYRNISELQESLNDNGSINMLI